MLYEYNFLISMIYLYNCLGFDELKKFDTSRGLRFFCKSNCMYIFQKFQKKIIDQIATTTKNFNKTIERLTDIAFQNYKPFIDTFII